MAEKIIKFKGERGTWKLFKEIESSKYCLYFEGNMSGSINKYWNDGIKDNDGYIFYRDIDLGVKEKIELSMVNEFFQKDGIRWTISVYINAYRHKYSEWSIQCHYCVS